MKTSAQPPVPRPPPDKGDDMLIAGKRAHELTRDEAVAVALHFRDAHVESLARAAAADRRMKKLEEAIPKDDVKRLDRWLKAHRVDALRGDGSEQYPNWQKWNG